MGLFSILRDSTDDGPGGVRLCQQEVTHEVTKENHKYISVAKSSSGQNSPLRLKISSFCHARNQGIRECSLLPDISTTAPLKDPQPHYNIICIATLTPISLWVCQKDHGKNYFKGESVPL